MLHQEYLDGMDEKTLVDHQNTWLIANGGVTKGQITKNVPFWEQRPDKRYRRVATHFLSELLRR